MLIIDLHSSNDACSSYKPCMRITQVSQADYYVSTVFTYDVCTVLIMRSIFFVLTLFVPRCLVNSFVMSDIVHFYVGHFYMYEHIMMSSTRKLCPLQVRTTIAAER